MLIENWMAGNFYDLTWLAFIDLDIEDFLLTLRQPVVGNTTFQKNL